MAFLNVNGQITDEWVKIADSDPITPRTRVIVSLERLANEGELIFRTGADIGVVLQPDARIEDLAPYISRLSLIVLAFSTMKDGRSFTLARILRTRFKFTGELRAAGPLIPDQVPFLVRCGFDTFDVADSFETAAIQKSLSYYTHLYQRPVDDARDIIAIRGGAR